MKKLLLPIVILSAVLVHGVVANHLHTAHSVLWVDGMRVIVTFTSSMGGSSFGVNVNTTYTFTVNQLPADLTLYPTPSTRCSPDQVGPNITSHNLFTHSDGDINLPLGLQQLVFRSLSVYNGTTLVGCGNIVPSGGPGDISALKAVFTKRIAGTVYVIQAEEDTFIVGKLYWTTGAMNDMYSLRVYSGFVNFYDAANGSCGGASGTTENTLISELSVEESPIPYSQGAFYVYTTLTTSGLTNQTLGVVGTNGIVSCALLQTLSNVGVSTGSSASMIQLIPYEYAFVTDNAIRRYQVYTDAHNPGTSCTDRTVFNPLRVSGGSDPASVPVGNLPAKGIVLPNYVPEVPLLGRYTIVGHRLSTPSCDFLRPTSSNLERIIMATVTFDAAGVNGTIVFRQLVFNGGILGPTFITLGLYYGDGRARTVGHNWHVHQRRRPSNGQCLGPVGGHYNPFNVNLTNPAYAAQCGSDSKFRCEMGDQSGKHGKLTIESTSSPIVLYDENLHLAGPFTILGRSIVVHDHLDGSYLTCANIEPAILSGTQHSINFPRNGVDATDLNFRIDLANAVANAARVPLGDVLVYDVENFNVSNTECLRATLRMTGASQAVADQNAQAVMDINTGNLGQYSVGNICGTSPTSSGFVPKMSAVVMVILATLALFIG